MTVSLKLLLPYFPAWASAFFLAFVGPVSFAQSGASNPPDCTPQLQLDVSKIKQQIVLVGEVHGTKEMPAFTSGLVCSLLKDGRSVILAVERFAEEQEHLQLYIESEGTAADRSGLLGVHMWASRWQDGRSSEAMFALVEDIRKLRKGGQRVGILAMQKLGNLKVPMTKAESAPLSFADQKIHSIINDRVMADSLMAASVLYRKYTVVALAGYAHTSTRKGSSRDAEYLPLGHLISAMEPTFIIGVRHGGGEFWGGGSSYRVVQLQYNAFFEEGDKVDAVISIPKFTASPSANPEAAALAMSQPADN
jgi:hypothetical protein